jgi:hypothetical protein
MHWITKNRNIAYGIGFKAGRAYELGQITIEQLRVQQAEVVANPPEFPDPHSEAGWKDGVESADRLIAESSMFPVKLAPGVPIPWRHIRIHGHERSLEMFDLKEGDLICDHGCIFRIRDRRYYPNENPNRAPEFDPPIVSFGTDIVAGVWPHAVWVLDRYRIQGTKFRNYDVINPAAVDLCDAVAA